MTDPTDVDAPAEVSLSLPARAPYARVARLAVAALASRLDYAYDEIEDLRIGVGEAFGLLFDDAPGRPHDPARPGRIDVRCTLDGDAIAVELSRPDHRPSSPLNELSRQILVAVADEAHVDTERAVVVLSKRQRD